MTSPNETDGTGADKAQNEGAGTPWENAFYIKEHVGLDEAEETRDLLLNWIGAAPKGASGRVQIDDLENPIVIQLAAAAMQSGREAGLELALVAADETADQRLTLLSTAESTT